MMVGEKIDKARWEKFLDDFSKVHHGYVARIEIIGRQFGDQEEAAWMPLSGISYDPHHDQIFVTVGGISGRYPVHLTHMIDKPTMLHVNRNAEGMVTSLVVVSADKTETIVHLRQEPQLPE